MSTWFGEYLSSFIPFGGLDVREKQRKRACRADRARCNGGRPVPTEARALGELGTGT